LVAEDVAKGTLSLDDLSSDDISERLYTAGLPDPELLIRTSGELRLSNYLLWQLAYTEMYVTDVLWPDFTRWEYLRAIRSFQHRGRRFGGVVES
jgi:undecaprenyl diphosphate synthase